MFLWTVWWERVLLRKASLELKELDMWCWSWKCLTQCCVGSSEAPTTCLGKCIWKTYNNSYSLKIHLSNVCLSFPTACATIRNLNMQFMKQAGNYVFAGEWDCMFGNRVQRSHLLTWLKVSLITLGKLLSHVIPSIFLSHILETQS